MNVTDALTYLLARLKEPSTYAGLAGLLAADHISNSSGIAAAVTSIMIGAASLAAILIAEKK